MANIAFIVSTNKKRGQGHLARCLNIRTFIKKKVVWFIDYDIAGLFPKNDQVIKSKKISLEKILNIISNHSISLIVIDSYDINNKLKTEISNKVKVITIEDKLFKIYGCKVIYPHPVSINKKKLDNVYAGIRYAPINIIKKKKIEKYLFKKKEINILINMGSYDSKGYSVIAMKAVLNLIKIVKIKINCAVFIGNSCPQLKNIKKLIKENSCFKLHLDNRNIKDYYPNFDLALGALGVSFLERIYVGVPSIIIPQNKIQRELIRYWKEKDVAFLSDNNIYSMLNSMISLIVCDNIRLKKVKNGQALLDGLGAKRIVKIIKKHNEDKIPIF